MSKNSKRDYQQYVNQLNEENYRFFMEIMEYIDCSDSMYEHKNECLEEILDLMISAQQDGVEMNLVIGTNYQKLCENILQSINATNNAQRIVLRICGFGITAVVLGLVELAFSYMNISLGWVKDDKINILHPFMIAMLIVGIDWGVEVIIRRQLVKHNSDTMYKKRSGIKMIIWVVSGLIGGILSEIIAGSVMTYKVLFVNLTGLLIMGGAIVLFSVIFYILLSLELNSKQKNQWRKEENRTEIVSINRKNT